MENTVIAVEELFLELEKDISEFREKTGIYCISGCGACCKKPDIEATALEFLPFAFYVYKQGEAENIFKQLDEGKDICILFKSFPEKNINAGTCTRYAHRGLICRLFGFSARVNKHEKPELATCKIIKESQKENYQNAVRNIERGINVPVMRDYYFRLRAIDENLGGKFYPINQAIMQALEKVMIYYAYR